MIREAKIFTLRHNVHRVEFNVLGRTPRTVAVREFHTEKQANLAKEFYERYGIDGAVEFATGDYERVA